MGLFIGISTMSAAFLVMRFIPIPVIAVSVTLYLYVFSCVLTAYLVHKKVSKKYTERQINIDPLKKSQTVEKDGFLEEIKTTLEMAKYTLSVQKGMKSLDEENKKLLKLVMNDINNKISRIEKE